MKDNVIEMGEAKKEVASRAERRRQAKNELKQQKQMSLPPSRAEMYQFLNNLSGAINDTNRKLDVMSLVASALTDIIVDKGICTKEDVGKKIDHIVEETNKKHLEMQRMQQAADRRAVTREVSPETDFAASLLMGGAASGAVTQEAPSENPENA